MSSASRIAQALADLERRLKSVERGPQLTRSSFEHGGTVYTIPGVTDLAIQADANAAQAIDTASSAEAKADGAVVALYQTTAPAATEVTLGDLWIDTDDGNKAYHWNGSAWEPVTSQKVADALAASADAQAAADGKITTYYATTAPAATAVGDIWFDTDDANKMYRWDGASWVLVRDTGIDTALTNAANAQSKADSAMTAANDAQATADGKVRTFFQAAAPTGLVAGDVGDLWFDTDDANKMYRWDGTAWVLSRDQGISQAITDAQNANTAAGNAQTTADKKITTYYQTAAPTASTVGDLWVDTDDKNRLYRWDGAAWVDVEAGRIADAQNAASNAQSTANGKGKVYYQTAAPTGATVQDLWFDTDDSNRLYRWDGAAWVSVGLGDAAISNLNVGKLVAGTLSAQYVVIAGRLTTKADASQTGARVELDSAGLRAYDANGVRTVNVGADGSAEFTGTVKSSSLIGSNFQTATSGSRVEIGPSWDNGAGIRMFQGTDGNPTLRMTVHLNSGTNRSAFIRGPFDNLSYVNMEMNSDGRVTFAAADTGGGNAGEIATLANNRIDLRKYTQIHSDVYVNGAMDAGFRMTAPRARIGTNGKEFHGIAQGVASGTTDSGGYLTINHNLSSVTPGSVFAQIGATGGGAWWTPTDSYNTTSFRVRVLTVSGGNVVAYGGKAVTIHWLALA